MHGEYVPGRNYLITAALLFANCLKTSVKQCALINIIKRLFYNYEGQSKSNEPC